MQGGEFDSQICSKSIAHRVIGAGADDIVHPDDNDHDQLGRDLEEKQADTTPMVCYLTMRTVLRVCPIENLHIILGVVPLCGVVKFVTFQRFTPKRSHCVVVWALVYLY